MNALYHPVRLGMIGGGEHGGDPKHREDVAPEIGGELSALVCDDLGRNAVASDPATEEGSRARGGRDVLQGEGLDPARKSVNDG